MAANCPSLTVDFERAIQVEAVAPVDSPPPMLGGGAGEGWPSCWRRACGDYSSDYSGDYGGDTRAERFHRTRTRPLRSSRHDPPLGNRPRRDQTGGVACTARQLPCRDDRTREAHFFSCPPATSPIPYPSSQKTLCGRCCYRSALFFGTFPPSSQLKPQNAITWLAARVLLELLFGSSAFTHDGRRTSSSSSQSRRLHSGGISLVSRTAVPAEAALTTENPATATPCHHQRRCKPLGLRPTAHPTRGETVAAAQRKIRLYWRIW